MKILEVKKTSKDLKITEKSRQVYFTYSECDRFKSLSSRRLRFVTSDFEKIVKHLYHSIEIGLVEVGSYEILQKMIFKQRQMKVEIPKIIKAINEFCDTVLIEQWSDETFR